MKRWNSTPFAPPPPAIAQAISPSRTSALSSMIASPRILRKPLFCFEQLQWIIACTGGDKRRKTGLQGGPNLGRWPRFQLLLLRGQVPISESLTVSIHEEEQTPLPDRRVDCRGGSSTQPDQTSHMLIRESHSIWRTPPDRHSTLRSVCVDTFEIMRISHCQPLYGRLTTHSVCYLTIIPAGTTFSLLVNADHNSTQYAIIRRICFQVSRGRRGRRDRTG